jgi:hypothetical protein
VDDDQTGPVTGTVVGDWGAVVGCWLLVVGSQGRKARNRWLKRLLVVGSWLLAATARAVGRQQPAQMPRQNKGDRLDTKGYRDLVVWQRAIDMVPAVYNLVVGFPPHETFSLANQIRRAVVSMRNGSS